MSERRRFNRALRGGKGEKINIRDKEGKDQVFDMLGDLMLDNVTEIFITYRKNSVATQIYKDEETYVKLRGSYDDTLSVLEQMQMRMQEMNMSRYGHIGVKFSTDTKMEFDRMYRMVDMVPATNGFEIDMPTTRKSLPEKLIETLERFRITRLDVMHFTIKDLALCAE